MMITREQTNRIMAYRRIKYKDIVVIVEKYLKRLQVTPATDIFIYIDYPFGWHALVGGSYERVYMIKYSLGKMDFWAYEGRGFRPNGTMIYKKDKMV